MSGADQANRYLEGNAVPRGHHGVGRLRGIRRAEPPERFRSTSRNHARCRLVAGLARSGGSAVTLMNGRPRNPEPQTSSPMPYDGGEEVGR